MFVNSIVMEGTMNGYDIDLTQQALFCGKYSVIASVAGKIHDFHYALKNGGASAVAAGSNVFHEALEQY